MTNLFGAATNLLRRVDDFGTNIAMAGIKHGVNVAKGTFLVCPLAESGIPTCAIYALCTQTSPAWLALMDPIYIPGMSYK